MASAVAQACNRDLGAEPPSGVQGRSPWSGGQGLKTLWRSWSTFGFWTFNGSRKFGHFLKFGNAKILDICIIFAKNHGWPRNWWGWSKTGGLKPSLPILRLDHISWRRRDNSTGLYPSWMKHNFSLFHSKHMHAFYCFWIRRQACRLEAQNHSPRKITCAATYPVAPLMVLIILLWRLTWKTKQTHKKQHFNCYYYTKYSNPMFIKLITKCLQAYMSCIKITWSFLQQQLRI